MSHCVMCERRRRIKETNTERRNFDRRRGARRCEEVQIEWEKENVRKSLNTIRIIHCGFFVCVKRQIYGEVCQMCLPCWIEKYCAIYQEALSYEDI